MNKKQLVALIESIVKKEVQKAVRSQLKSTIKETIFIHTPKIVREIIDDELEESLLAIKKTIKKSPLTESMDTLTFDSSDLGRLAGRHISRNGASINGAKYRNVITEVPVGEDAMMTRSVDPSEVPEYLLKAMNRDYRDVLAAAEEHRGAGMHTFIPPTARDFDSEIR